MTDGSEHIATSNSPVVNLGIAGLAGFPEGRPSTGQARDIRGLTHSFTCTEGRSHLSSPSPYLGSPISRQQYSLYEPILPSWFPKPMSFDPSQLVLCSFCETPGYMLLGLLVSPSSSGVWGVCAQEIPTGTGDSSYCCTLVGSQYS